MFIYILINFYVLPTLHSENILSGLWDDQDVAVKRVLTGNSVSDKENAILIERLSQVPFTRELKSNVWHKLLRYRSVQQLNLNEWKAYEPLIPYLPSSFLLGVNFSDENVLNYFGSQENFLPSQLSLVAEAISAKSGLNVLRDEETILKMGNFFCGFSAEDLRKLNSTIFRSLLRKNFFQSLYGCNIDQLRVLSKSIQRFTIIGPARTWRPETVRSAGVLLAGLDEQQIRGMKDNSFAWVDPSTISKTPVYILNQLRTKQLLALDRKSLLTWRRKTKNLTPLYSAAVVSFPTKILIYLRLFFYDAIIIILTYQIIW